MTAKEWIIPRNDFERMCLGCIGIPEKILKEKEEDKMKTKEIQRYDIVDGYGQHRFMAEDDEGIYVLYEDYLKAKKEMREKLDKWFNKSEGNVLLEDDWEELKKVVEEETCIKKNYPKKN